MPESSVPKDDFEDAFAAAQALRRGINLGNMLEAPNEGDWGLRVQEEYFDLIRERGFDFVRIPIRWNTHAGTEAPFTVQSSFFSRIDQVLGWALARDLAVILDFHHYEEMMTDPSGHRERYLAIVRQVAEHYRDQPPSVSFELLNEPNSALSASAWNGILVDALAAVRESNPGRLVIVGPVQWNSFTMLPALHLPEDDHILVTFHYYEPFEFTHQGAEWVDGSGAWLGTTWEGNESEQQRIQRDFDQVVQWAEQNHRPILLGEFGAYSRADEASRLRWTQFIREQAEARGFGWAYWEFGSTFGIYDPAAKRWREDLAGVLIP